MNYKPSIGIFFEKTIGDLIYSSSLVASIRKNNPEANIHVVTSDIGLSILNSDKPDYNYISTSFNNLSNYDIIYYFLRCLQCVPYWFNHGIHMRDLAALSCGIKLSVTNTNIIQPKEKDVDDCVKLKNERYIIINNEASSDRLKQLPVDMINNLTKTIAKDFNIYQIGLSKDVPIDNCDLSLLGRTSIVDALYLIKNAAAVVSIDNYVSHAACAYNTPMLACYGQYDWSQVCPVDINKKSIIINKGIVGNFNSEGCTKITQDELLDGYNKLKEMI